MPGLPAVPTPSARHLLKVPTGGASGGGALTPGGVRPFLSAFDPWRAQQTVSFGASPAVRVGIRVLWKVPALRDTQGRACAFVPGPLLLRCGSTADGKGALRETARGSARDLRLRRRRRA